MSKRPAPRLCAAGVTLRDQLNRRFPKRDKASDGWIGDASHAARFSFHNPDPVTGIVHAIDVDEDFGKQGDAMKFAEELADYCRKGLDGGRIAHIVYEDKVASATADDWHFRGRGFGHTHHIHISFTKKADYDGKPFDLPIFKVAPAKPKAPERIAVTSRDTWGSLAEKYGNDIASRNGLTFKSPLHAGQILR